MLAHPPEILITTPESLNLMLSSRRPAARPRLAGHGHPGRDPRGGRFEQARHPPDHGASSAWCRSRASSSAIALSATVRPLETVAEFVGGFRLESGGSGSRPAAKAGGPVAIRPMSGPAKARYDLRASAPSGRRRARRTVRGGPSGSALVANSAGHHRAEPLHALLRPELAATAETLARLSTINAGERPARLFPPRRRCRGRSGSTVGAAAQGGRAQGHRGHQLPRARDRHRRARRGGSRPVAALDRLGHPARRPGRPPGGRRQPRHLLPDLCTRTSSKPAVLVRGHRRGTTSRRRARSKTRSTSWPRSSLSMVGDRDLGHGRALRPASRRATPTAL